MPALEVLGRRWYIGSDDLVFPSFFCILMRTFWVFILGSRFSSYLHSTSNKECNHPSLVLFYLATATALISLVLLLEILVMTLSMRGGIMQVEKRRAVPTLLHFRLFLFLLEIGLCVFGTYWCFVESGCDRDILISVRLVVISNWVLIALTLIGIIAVFDPFGGYHSDKSMNDKLWEKRFKSWCCCVGKQENSHGAFQDLARIFSSQFADVDLVASDIAVGLMIVSQQQHLAAQKRTDLHQMSFESECERYNFENRESRETFQDLTYFSSYALGAYGWPLFMYIHPITGCFNLCQECSLFGGGSDGSDNACHSNHIALKKLSGLEDNDILYTHFTSNIYSPAFYVAVDHNRQVIIVTVRGTLSLQDVITDMVCEPQEIPGSPGLRAHRGMVLSASNILAILEKDGVLERAFSLYPEFQLLILGHSLGAGTATILGFMLRHRYPSLRCFAYGPPGGLLSEDAAEESKKFVVSTVVNKEFATRLSINSIVQLKDSVLAAIQGNLRSKWKLTLDHILSVMRLRPIAEVLLNSEEEAPLILPTFDRAGEEEDQSEIPKLLPPGKIIFIHRNEIQAGCCSSYSGSHYDVLLAPNTVFDSIPVAPEMLTDHLPDTLVHLLKELQPIDISPGSHV